MNKNTIIGLAVAVLIIVAALFWFVLQDKTNVDEPTAVSTTTEDPLDVTIDFYNNWLAALQSTTTDPYQSGLLDMPIVGPEVRAMIEQKKAEAVEGDREPVICQSIIPERVGGKVIFASDSDAQIMMLARGGETKAQYQAIVTLAAVEGAWQIKRIDCAQGETGPEREFDFEHSGFLLKQSVPAPLDPQYWHLVYEVDGKPGYTAPLFFDAESSCVAIDGTEAICTPDQFKEGTKAYVQASMSEAGGTVEKLRFE